VFFTSHEHVVGFTTFFWCVSLIQLNAWKDKWLVSIGDWQEGKKKQEEWPKKQKGLKKWLVGDSSILANWVQIQMGKTLKTINLHKKDFYF